MYEWRAKARMILCACAGWSESMNFVFTKALDVAHMLSYIFSFIFCMTIHWIFWAGTPRWDASNEYHNIGFLGEIRKKKKKSGPSCTKLTMSLVNDSLKFTSSDTQICWIFFCWKMWVAFALTFFQQKISEYCILKSAKTVNEMTLNELVKLTTLWTTGPSIFCWKSTLSRVVTITLMNPTHAQPEPFRS